MQDHHSIPNSPKQSIPHGFIAAVPMSSGDVLGVSYDGDELCLRWVDAQTDDAIPLTFSAEDLPRVEQLIRNARALFESEG